MTSPARFLLPVLLAATCTVAAPAADLAQNILAQSGWVTFTYPAREGVHGDGQHITINGDGMVVETAPDDGLVHATLRVRDGAVDRIELRVGRAADRHEATARVIAGPDPAAAAAFMLRLARDTDDEDLGHTAVAAAAMADAEIWPELVTLARDRDRPEEVREAAIFWLGMQAGEKIRGELAAIIDDDSEEIDLREHAVFALHQSLEDDPRAIDTLSRIATENPHPQIRRSALFWLAQHDEPEVVDLFERILLD
jgi:hypothetical protein